MNIGLDNKTRTTIVGMLNLILADEYVLYFKARKFHWNVSGPLFDMLHNGIFKNIYERLEETTDEVAERIRALGGYPLSTMTEFVQHARLKEAPGVDAMDARNMVFELLNDYETLIRIMRENDKNISGMGDSVTSGYIQTLILQHEKTAWMLRSSVK